MIRQWFDARGSMGREAYLAQTTLAWLIGHLGFIVYFCVFASSSGFAGLGGILDHRAMTLDAIARDAGWVWASLTAGLWLAQAWVLAALSSKRLHDMGQGGWLAGLALVPSIGVLAWLALCAWPASGAGRVRTA
ncbi:DUF805 domain-containing protein [Caulobacter vibrioides]|uniref:DUF805 domain-containing protein n=1 Tax=Caulobacter vibrioides TaxID=155892 RepID=A0A290MK68_CAUVI|nr:DUF805 domain-containing protein [Caulobacter vibrioides]ATC32400.1 DUF805 domain-containing protein [Caulobacter vibrioides]